MRRSVDGEFLAGTFVPVVRVVADGDYTVNGDDDTRLMDVAANLRHEQYNLAVINNELKPGDPSKAQLTGWGLALEKLAKEMEPRRLRVVRGGDDAS